MAVLFGGSGSLAVEMTFSPNALMRRHWLGWLGSPGDSRAWSGGNLGTGLGFAFDPKHGRQPLENLKESSIMVIRYVNIKNVHVLETLRVFEVWALGQWSGGNDEAWA